MIPRLSTDFIISDISHHHILITMSSLIALHDKGVSKQTTGVLSGYRLLFHFEVTMPIGMCILHNKEVAVASKLVGSL